MKVKIREIFESVQGEGPYIGYRQLFIRFCTCNLNCLYCDTDFNASEALDYSPDELFVVCEKHKNIHSVSLTGGEPLMKTEFLKEFLLLVKQPIYLETNGTLYQNLKEILNYITYISADIKLPSVSGNRPLWNEHEKFFSVAKEKNLFAKVVFDNTITDEEIELSAKLCKKYDTELILQPKMNDNIMSVTSDFASQILDKFLCRHSKVRLIPQVHKFLGVQ